MKVAHILYKHNAVKNPKIERVNETDGQITIEAVTRSREEAFEMAKKGKVEKKKKKKKYQI